MAGIGPRKIAIFRKAYEPQLHRLMLRAVGYDNAKAEADYETCEECLDEMAAIIIGIKLDLPRDVDLGESTGNVSPFPVKC